jgi:hypothetical protein
MGHRHSKHNTQREQLLRELKAVAPDWLPLGRVIELGGPQYNARIFELRSLGHPIENKSGWFRLAVKPATLVTPPTPMPVESGPDSLFDELPPRPYRDPEEG